MTSGDSQGRAFKSALDRSTTFLLGESPCGKYQSYNVFFAYRDGTHRCTLWTAATAPLEYPFEIRKACNQIQQLQADSLSRKRGN